MNKLILAALLLAGMIGAADAQGWSPGWGPQHPGWRHHGWGPRPQWQPQPECRSFHVGPFGFSECDEPEPYYPPRPQWGPRY